MRVDAGQVILPAIGKWPSCEKAKCCLMLSKEVALALTIDLFLFQIQSHSDTYQDNIKYSYLPNSAVCDQSSQVRRRNLNDIPCCNVKGRKEGKMICLRTICMCG